ncbi:MAG: alpha/beta hydrolase [Rubrivivax sp.]|nr:alpha/beta hydrolase [Rubrivivax sp.]
MKRDPIDLDASLVLPDGRHLAYRVYGHARGKPILFFHGFPGSRLQAALLHEPALRLGLALVTFDRPGFGRSDPAHAPAVDDVIADVGDLADHLGLKRFGVIGASCGGPYALATARLMPHRVSAVGLLAGIGPMNRPELRGGQLPLLRALFGLARVHPMLASPLLALDGALFRSRPERAVQALASMLTPPDRLLLESNSFVRQTFAADLAEAYRQGIAGAMGEAQRIARHSAVSLRGVDAPVHVFQGAHDRHVPPAMARFMAARLPGAVLHERPDEGHLSIVVHAFEECVREVLRYA